MKKDNVWHHGDDSPNKPIQYTGCGLDDIYLASGYEYHETPYGTGLRINNLDELHKAIGSFLVKYRKTLEGAEVRFLRHQLDLTQAELSRLIGCDSQTIARYEKNITKMGGPPDRILRILFGEHLENHGSARSVLELYDSIDDSANFDLLFGDDDGHWKYIIANAA